MKIRNPDPAWPEVVAAFVLGALLLASNLSTLTFTDYLRENWWPMLRIVLWIWVPLRLFDLWIGGPSKRAAMRVAYRNLQRYINGLR